MNTTATPPTAGAAINPPRPAATPSRKAGTAWIRPSWVPVLSIAGGLLLWELLGRQVANPLFLATPLQTIDAIVGMLMSGELGHHAWVSFIEFAVGYVLAAILGIAIGLGMATSPTISRILSPWVSGLYATPIIAIAPLIILWFGIGVWSKIFVVASMVIFPVIINTEAGIRGTSKVLIEAIRSFGASQTQIFRIVSIPAAMSFILTGLRLGIGRGLIGVVVGEMFGSRAGLGFVILQSAEAFRMPQLFAAVVLLAMAGILLTAGFYALERRLVPWNGH